MSRIWLQASLLLMLAVSPRLSAAESEVQVEINRGEQESPEFRFEKIPSPSATDAASGAKLKIVAGRRDENGGRPLVLTDGKLPGGADEPASNFFFAPGSNGGRLLVDLGESTGVKKISSYSWHPQSRGPQVYKLYGDKQRAKSFDVASAGHDELAEADWQLIASVDSRPEEGDEGGQHGVNITGPKGRDLGTFRYLLFDIAPTEMKTPFGQTFFSEIDVDDGREHEAPAQLAPEVVRIGDKYEIVFDASDAPDLMPWIKETLIPICTEWYPKIVDLLPSDGYAAPERFTITFHSDMGGVAHAMGTEIHCSAPWFAQNLDGEAAGAVVHEMVHIVQQYGRTRGAHRNPGWMVEGAADYIRWFLYEPVEKRRQPNPDRANYTDSYQTTAAFLDYVVAEHDPKLVEKFNAAMRQGEYDDKLWEQYTGKTVDELWAEYVRTLKAGK
ncbi:basic secretory protein-like protein [Lacipirellula sp.]|uniref:basic secretory protein-like protein n=1 Tax=Lacipirellula sp. TaxID=2691419 RepID=UPI003D0C607E